MCQRGSARTMLSSYPELTEYISCKHTLAAPCLGIVSTPKLLCDITVFPRLKPRSRRTGEFNAEENTQFPCVRVSGDACFTRRKQSRRSAGREGFLSRHGS